MTTATPLEPNASLARECDWAVELAETMDPDKVVEAARTLNRLREFAGWIATATRTLEQALGAELGSDVVAVEGVGMVAGAWQSGNWDWGDTDARAAIVRRVAQAARDRRHLAASGEVESEAEAAVRAIIETFTVYPRVTGLKNLDLDPAEFGTRGDGRHTVRIQPLTRS